MTDDVAGALDWLEGADDSVEAEAGETRPLLYCDRSYGRVALH